MADPGKNPQGSLTFQRDDLLGKLRRRTFAVEIVHGDFSEGKGHYLKLFLTEEGKRSSHFQLVGAEHPIALSDIVKLSLSNERSGFSLFAHWSWKRVSIPIGVFCGTLVVRTLVGKALWPVGIAVTLCSAVLSTSLGKKVRFLCKLKDDRYFTALMPAEGYKLLTELVEGENSR